MMTKTGPTTEQVESLEKKVDKLEKGISELKKKDEETKKMLGDILDLLQRPRRNSSTSKYKKKEKYPISFPEHHLIKSTIFSDFTNMTSFDSDKWISVFSNEDFFFLENDFKISIVVKDSSNMGIMMGFVESTHMEKDVFVGKSPCTVGFHFLNGKKVIENIFEELFEEYEVKVGETVEVELFQGKMYVILERERRLFADLSQVFKLGKVRLGFSFNGKNSVNVSVSNE